jgi:hypothetical protein
MTGKFDESIVDDVDDLVNLDEDAVEEEEELDADEFFQKRAFRVVYQTNNFLLPQLRSLIEERDVVNIRPEYQRRLRWSNPQKSKLIESLLLNIPVPPIFFYESEEARYEVMDGQQRINAIKEYLGGDFALSTLSVLKPLNRLTYGKLPPRVKRALDRASLSAIVLLAESEKEKLADDGIKPVDIRRFIFDRLNTGGRKLNAQELRNAIYPGKFCQAIVEMARRREFTDLFGIPAYTEAEPNDYYENPKRQRNILFSTMGDCALVLRFFALTHESNIRGSMKSMLDRAMESRMSATDAEVATLTRGFEERFDVTASIFGPEPFRMLPDEKGRRRLSAGLYDSAMVAVDRNWQHRDAFVQNKVAIKQLLEQELAIEDKIPILTGKISTSQGVKDRILLMENLLLTASGLAQDAG